MATKLIHYDAAKVALAKAHRVDEAKDIRDKAIALAAYARQAKDSDMVEWATEIRVRAERRAGELLRTMAETGERVKPHDARHFPESRRAIQGKTLDDLGINLSQSSRWQKLAAVSDENFEHAVAAAKETAREVTGVAVTRLAQRAEREQTREEKRRINTKKVAAIGSPSELLKSDVRFSTLVVDPPWDWGDEGDVNQLGRAKPDYATLTIDQLQALPVGALAGEDSHIYLWITNRSLPKGFGLLEAWDFRYVTALTWAKPSFGMGNYFRGQTEHVLFGVRGSQPLLRKDVGTVFHAPRGSRGHSSKPVEFYALVESCSPGPYLELFARGKRDGWVTWGDL